jgi:hypothetical protein
MAHELTLGIQDGVVGLLLLLASDQLHHDVFRHESCVRIRTVGVRRGVSELWQLLATSHTLRHDVLGDFVHPHHFHLLVILVEFVFRDGFVALSVG